MSIYRHNLLLDTLRLVRGALFKTRGDPFIETNPHALFARDSLFHFDWILKERGDYAHRYAGYTPYISPQPLLMHYLPAAYGRAAFAHLMSHKAERIGCISALLEESGIRLEPSIPCWNSIGAWLFEHIEASSEGRVEAPSPISDSSPVKVIRLRPLCYSLLIDLSLLLGEHVMSRRPDCRWYFWGDLDLVNPQAFGRNPWVLCETPPESGRWDHQPDRFVPFDLLESIATNMLRRKATESSASHSLGELFEQLTTAGDEPPGAEPYDAEVADLCRWFEEFNQRQQGDDRDSDRRQALDSFLRQYVDRHGYLPRRHDLEILRGKFGGIPEWVQAD